MERAGTTFEKGCLLARGGGGGVGRTVREGD